jgi:cytochrome P450
MTANLVRPPGSTKPPGPKGRLHSPLLGGAGPLVNLPRLAAQYGDVVFWRFLHLQVCLLAHPKDIEAVLVTLHRSFSKGFGARASPEVFGNGLLTSEGDFWLRQRRLSQPAFHRERIAAYAATMGHHVQGMLDGWSDGQVFDVHGEMINVTLSVAADALFGVDIAPHMETIRAATERLIFRQNSGLSPLQLVFKIPTAERRRYNQAVQELNEVVYRIIGERRASGRGEDLLSALLGAKDTDGSSMTDRQLRDEIMTMLLAGHETTALLLSWTWLLLGQNPEAEAKLHDELDRVLAGRAATAADADRLPYTNRVLREAMRLYPPAWIITRSALEPVTIGGYVIPKGTNIVMSPWLTHRDARFFPEPERFYPDRWLADDARNLPRFAYFPFSGGARQCIGQSFALTEGMVLLATIAQRFRLELVPGQRVEPRPGFTLRPKHEVMVKLHQR